MVEYTLNDGANGHLVGVCLKKTGGSMNISDGVESEIFSIRAQVLSYTGTGGSP